MPHDWKVFPSRAGWQPPDKVVRLSRQHGIYDRSDLQSSSSKDTMENNMKKGFGWYFLAVGLFGIVMAFARAKSEGEIFLVLATIPTAFLVVRGAEFLRKKNNKE